MLYSYSYGTFAIRQSPIFPKGACRCQYELFGSVRATGEVMGEPPDARVIREVLTRGI